MEPQERDLITTLLTRLKDAGGQPKDSEADALIRQAMTQMPDAPYYLVQTVLIQDLSLQNAQGRIAELEKRVASLNAPQQRTSFLGGLLGGGQQSAGSAPPSGPWTRAPQAGGPAPQYAPQGYPQQGYAQQGYAPAGGGGMFGGGGNSFLKSAAATAAGVAGGALLFQGISSLFGHSYASGLGGFGGMGMGGMGGGISETVINNYGDSGGGYAGGDYGGDAGGGGGGYAGGDSGGDSGGGWDGGGSGSGSDGGGSWDSGGGGDFGGGGDGGSSSSC
jgi:uncharacterized protein